MTIRTRFAPSPTGYLHIGGARTALFCYLHARRHGGQYILRIEDTDRERSTQAAVDAILEGLAWMGLTPDEPPYYQSRHAADHLAAAQRLLDAGKAYRCWCSKASLDALREQQRANGEKPRYDGRCFTRTDGDVNEPHVIRFRTPMDGETVWEDRIQGTIRYPNNELDDLILVRADGTPTYNLAVVVDDHNMGINFIVRGEDHLSNTPRQIHLFQALGWEVPTYAHMPLLHGSDGAKLSKRHGAVSVLQYREDGFLPAAVNNYLVRLGWSHGEQELFTMEEMQALFDVAQVGRSAAIFDQKKLLWINSQHIQRATPESLVEPLLAQLVRIGFSEVDPAYATAFIPTLQGRAETIVEMAEKARFYVAERVEPFPEKALKKHIKADVIAPFADLLAAMAALPAWNEAALDGAFKATMERHGVKMGKLAQPARIALTGSDASPGIFEVLLLLGRERSIARMERGLALFREHAAAAGA